MTVRKNWKKVVSFLLAGTMAAAMTGCGKNAGGQEGNGVSTEQRDTLAPDGQKKEDGSEGGPAAMGRYVEEETDLSEQMTSPMDLCVREDGSLVIMDRFAGMLVSKDQGVTWETETPAWITDMQRRQDGYISNMWMAPDGTVAVLTAYSGGEGSGANESASQDGGADAEDETALQDSEADAAEESTSQDSEADAAEESASQDGEAEGAEDRESDAEDESASQEDESDGKLEHIFDITYVLTLVLADGTQVPVEVEMTEQEQYFTQVVMTDDNRIFASTLRSVYEVKRDGSAEKLVSLDYRPQWIWVRDNLLIMDSDWKQAETPAVYDLDAKDFISDEVLKEFVDANYDDRHYNGTDYGSMFLLPGEESTVYVVGKRGIHRHVIGGNMMEQIVDGSLSQLINPNYCVCDMVQLESGAFLALFSNGKIIKFTYDPNIPSVPEKILTLYSLKENDVIRQAISYYQTKHQDVFLSYQVGMGGDSAVTREDALKKLNTQIMAGEGPDLLVMDGLPLDSYVEKGLLVDLTDYLKAFSQKEPLFDNVTDALLRNGKAYVAPATISLPKVVTAADGIENMTDLSDLGEIIEKLREEYPTEDILRVSGERGILNRFAAASAPKWLAADGSIDRDVIGAYLEQCKRIFAAQMDGLNEKEVEYYNRRNELWQEYYGSRMDETLWSANMDVMQYVGGEQHMIAGWLEAKYVYTELMSLDKTRGLEDTKVVPMRGQCSNVFMPGTMLGISAASKQTELAYGFMDVFLSVETQGIYEGLPYNQAAFDEKFSPKEEDLGENGECGGISTMDEEGNIIDFIMYWPSDEEIAALREEMATVNTAYIPDEVLEEAVFTHGIAYMNGGQSLEEALDGIEKDVAIYMAE